MEFDLKAMEQTAKMMTTPEGQQATIKFAEAAWRHAGVEPNQPIEFDGMMKVVLFF